MQFRFVQNFVNREEIHGNPVQKSNGKKKKKKPKEMKHLIWQVLRSGLSETTTN